MQGWTATTRHGITRNRNTKRSKHTGNLLRERCLLSLDIGQRKVFYMQKIPEPSFAVKETFDTDNLVTSSNGKKKICSLSEKQADLPWEQGSVTSWASSDDHLPK